MGLQLNHRESCSRLGPPRDRQRYHHLPSDPYVVMIFLHWCTLCNIASQDGVPVLRVSPAQSQVAIPVRQVCYHSPSLFSVTDRYVQTMLKSLFDHFKVLYEHISDRNPTLAAEHSLRQEEEVYAKCTKLTYRHVRSVLVSQSHGSMTASGCHFFHSIS